MNHAPTFEASVKAVPSLMFCTGLKAIKGSDRKKIAISQPMNINGSANIDKAYLKSQPKACRWDYVIGYNDLAYFIEVHPADTSNVEEMLGKLAWIKNLLKTDAKPLDAIKAPNPYHWVATGGIDILPTSRHYRRCIAAGIMPKKQFSL